MSEQTATPSAETPKKPPAHEVILAVLHEKMDMLSVPMDLEAYYQFCGSIAALAAVLEKMDVPEKHHAAVAAELRAIREQVPSAFGGCIIALQKAADAISPAPA